MAKRGAREQQTELTKRRIYECASRLFEERGYDNVTIADILEASGVSNGSFYHHFKSKSELLAVYSDATESYYDAFYQDVLCGTQFAEKTELDKLIAFSNYSLKVLLYSGNVNSLRALAMLAMSNQGLRHGTVNPERRFRRYSLRLISEGQGAGCIRKDFSAEELFRMLLLEIDGILYHQIGNFEVVMNEDQAYAHMTKYVFALFKVQ